MSDEELGELIVGVVLLVSVIAGSIGAFVLDAKLHRRRPHVLPFKWGYFNGILAVCWLPVGVLGLMGASNLEEYFAVIYLLLVGVAGVFVLKRSRQAYLWLTILLFMPLLWIINGVYLSNRWKELGMKRRRRSSSPSEGDSSASDSPAPSVTEQIRAAGDSLRPQEPQGFSSAPVPSVMSADSGGGSPVPPALPAEIYIAQNGKKEGPFTLAEIITLLRTQTGTPLQTHLYWQPGMDSWRPFAELADRLRLTGALN